ncbi:DUF6252 family protein [Adhaeribacter terreus]|uniref:DUF6252 family protein n=1 Tax=Adhaeribacter terreus TaxID=529703 RepID=A0ABW0E7W7_9BACT
MALAVILLLTSCNKDEEKVDVFLPAATGTMKAKVNGQETSTVADATDAQTTSIIRMEISGTTEKSEMLSLVLPIINQAGTYDSVTSGRYVIIHENPQGITFQTWLAVSANLTVTKFDTLEKKISGSFSFLATPAQGNSATENKEITQGTFTDVPIRQ